MKKKLLLDVADNYWYDRAIMLLNVASEAVDKYCNEEMFQYDDTECDGYCLRDDLGVCAEMLEEMKKEIEDENSDQ